MPERWETCEGFEEIQGAWPACWFIWQIFVSRTACLGLTQAAGLIAADWWCYCVPIIYYFSVIHWELICSFYSLTVTMDTQVTIVRSSVIIKHWRLCCVEIMTGGKSLHCSLLQILDYNPIQASSWLPKATQGQIHLFTAACNSVLVCLYLKGKLQTCSSHNQYGHSDGPMFCRGILLKKKTQGNMAQSFQFPKHMGFGWD